MGAWSCEPRRVYIGWQSHAVNCQGAVPVVEQRMHGLCSVRYATPNCTCFPTPQNKNLTVRLHHLTRGVHDEAARHLCDELNANSVARRADPRLIYKASSC
jgi:hypothetical protein